jgi:probable HAF family extracellular repeat protein
MAGDAHRDSSGVMTSHPGDPFTVTIRDLGTLGGAESRAIGITPSGVIVGWSLDAAGVKRAFRWTLADGMQPLPGLASNPEGECEANHGNGAGAIAGYCVTARGQKHAVLWTADGASPPLDLGTLPGGLESQATDVNDAGVVVGTTIGDDAVPHAFRWTADAGLEPLPEFEAQSRTASTASRINTVGEIVGSGYYEADGYPFPVRWSVEGQIDTLQAPERGGASGENDLHQVVGGLFSYENLYTPDAGWEMVGAIDASDCCAAAYAINNAGYVVGWVDHDDAQRAFVWAGENGAHDLGALVPIDQGTQGAPRVQANDINDVGQAAGFSVTASGAVHAVRWTITIG